MVCVKTVIAPSSEPRGFPVHATPRLQVRGGTAAQPCRGPRGSDLSLLAADRARADAESFQSSPVQSARSTVTGVAVMHRWRGVAVADRLGAACVLSSSKER